MQSPAAAAANIPSAGVALESAEMEKRDWPALGVGARPLPTEGDPAPPIPIPMEAKTLAAWELVWAKPCKGRRRFWWPARLLAACPANGAVAKDTGVSYFGNSGQLLKAEAQVRRFADPDADGMARGSTARAFLAAVEEADASAVAALQASLTCGCIPPPSSEAGVVVVAGVGNLSPSEFLAELHDAALAGNPVGQVGRIRLKSWVRAFGEGWGQAGPGHYPRRTVEELVDKVDLNVAPGQDREDDEWLVDADQDEQEEVDLQQKKRSRALAAARMDKVVAVGDEKKNYSGTDAATSGRRERKRSKYLLPPYTDLDVIELAGNAVYLPRVLAASAVEDDSEVLQCDIVVEEILSLVLGIGKDVQLGSNFPKAAMSFLLSFRSSGNTLSDHGGAKSEMNVDVPMISSAIVDLPAQSAGEGNVPAEGVGTGDVPVLQSVGADVHVRSVGADVRASELSAPSPSGSLASRTPLMDAKKDLEKMILALDSSLKNATLTDGQKASKGKLLADMQAHLAQVDKFLGGRSTSTPPP